MPEAASNCLIGILLYLTGVQEKHGTHATYGLKEGVCKLKNIRRVTMTKVCLSGAAQHHDNITQ